MVDERHPSHRHKRKHQEKPQISKSDMALLRCLHLLFVKTKPSLVFIVRRSKRRNRHLLIICSSPAAPLSGKRFFAKRFVTMVSYANTRSRE